MTKIGKAMMALQSVPSPASGDADAILRRAERAGYELARREAVACGWHLRRYELALRDAEVSGAIHDIRRGVE